MKQRNQWLSISEMAQICGISRQTLIYYDKHNIFKPGYIDDKGYRYYSLYQLPFLREICSLKGDDVFLKEIIDNLKHRNLDNVLELLHSNHQKLEQELKEVQQKLNILNARLEYYDLVKKIQRRPPKPYITQCPERKIMFLPWDAEQIGRREMHYTHMKLRQECVQHGIPLAWGWGALFPKSSVVRRDYFAGAGGYINIPSAYIEKAIESDIEIKTIPGGFYACFAKYGMPYETDHMEILRSWIEKNHYIIIGDALDECMLDTTFYTEQHKRDFCQISIPVRLPGSYSDDDSTESE